MKRILFTYAFILSIIILHPLTVRSGDDLRMEIIEAKILCREEGRFIGWPSIAKARNGDLIAVFSGDRSGHVSPDGKLQMVRSSDGGRSWRMLSTIPYPAVRKLGRRKELGRAADSAGQGTAAPRNSPEKRMASSCLCKKMGASSWSICMYLKRWRSLLGD